jgi:hypothetical protein
VFDWTMSQPEAKRPRNPPGFLLESIKGEYAAPTSFVSRAEAEKRRAEADERKRKSEAKALAERQKQESKEVAKVKVAQEFWEQFSDEERARLEAEAMDAASEQERTVIIRGGPLAKTVRKHVLGRFDALPMMLNARSKGVRCVLGFQDIEGLQTAYGSREEAMEILNRCASVSWLKLNSPDTAQWASDRTGAVERWEYTTTKTKDGNNIGESLTERDAVTDGRIGGGAAPLAENPARAGESHQIVHRQEIRFDPELLNQHQFMVKLFLKASAALSYSPAL